MGYFVVDFISWSCDIYKISKLRSDYWSK